tara:strand:- start:3932 stop:4891 length:960 start_codon:yes stop_codon:yes gene_type:complete
MNILIYGGFNWLGYYLTEYFITKNIINNIVIIDNFQNVLMKENIRLKFDNFMHLYNINIFVYNYNISHYNRLKEIYRIHKINYVLNNIKYNIYNNHYDNNDLLVGYNNIKLLNLDFNIKKYICLYREITHNNIYLNPLLNKTRDYVEENKLLNNKLLDVNKNDCINIKFCDYVYGKMKNDQQNIILKMKNILDTGSPVYVYSCYFYCVRDDELLSKIIQQITYNLNYNENNFCRLGNHTVSKNEMWNNISACKNCLIEKDYVNVIKKDLPMCKFSYEILVNTLNIFSKNTPTIIYEKESKTKEIISSNETLFDYIKFVF